MKVWINGSFVPAAEASLSVFDAGIQHAVGLFETIEARDGKAFLGRAHMERLIDSAQQLRLADQLKIDPLLEAVQATITENGMEEARVRLTLTGGDLSGLQRTGATDHEGPTIFIVAQPPTPYPDVLFEHGVKVVFAEGRVNPFDPMAGHKTLNYWSRIRMLQDAGARKASEAIWLNFDATLACGCVSNVFIVSDGVIRTPTARGEEGEQDLPAPVLPGVTRRFLLDHIESTELAPVEIGPISPDDFFSADEVFLTNSSWGVLPVTSIEKESIGDGSVGPMTQALRRYWCDASP